MLNVEGINQLADDLVRDDARYNQSYWGQDTKYVNDPTPESPFFGTACGTVACLAGFCMARKIGVTEFNKVAAIYPGISGDSARFYGAQQLGIPFEAVIFNNIGDWPSDLRQEYRNAKPRGRVLVALKALQRLRPDGSIDPDPDVVHTPLKQLNALLEEKAYCESAKEASDDQV